MDGGGAAGRGLCMQADATARRSAAAGSGAQAPGQPWSVLTHTNPTGHAEESPINHVDRAIWLCQRRRRRGSRRRGRRSLRRWLAQCLWPPSASRHAPLAGPLDSCSELSALRPSAPSGNSGPRRVGRWLARPPRRPLQPPSVCVLSLPLFTSLCSAGA